MNKARFAFHGDLEDFLCPSWKNRIAPYCFHPHQTVKHLIEAAGIPHTEVSLILANGSAVNGDYRVEDNDQIDVYSHREKDGLGMVNTEAALFLLDNHLGKLARLLRMLGFDSMYDNDFQDEELARLASVTGRILLTRDRRLLMRSAVDKGYCLRSTSPRQQIVEVLQRYRLFGVIQPFTRCINCNGLLEAVTKNSIDNRLEPLTRQYFDQFNICQDCNQIYWRGSHHREMEKLIAQLTHETEANYNPQLLNDPE